MGGVDKGKGAKEHKIVFKTCDAKSLWIKEFIKQHWVYFWIEKSLNQRILKMLSKESTHNIQDLKLIYLRKKSFFTKFFAQSTVKETKNTWEELKWWDCIVKVSFRNTENTSE